ncbi:MAG: hypothetical protein RSC76_02060, partial [Oscillospiraceae bacterium]
MDFRKTFDTIPEEFDMWRPRYCSELFETVIKTAKIDSNSTVLEIGPGSGQATEPFLKQEVITYLLNLEKILPILTRENLADILIFILLMMILKHMISAH